MFRFFVIGLFLTLPAFSVAQTVDPDRLDELARQAEIEKNREAELGKSKEAVRQDIRSLRTTLVKLASEADVYEKAGREIVRKLSDLETNRTAITAKIYEDRKTLVRLLGALQRIEANPPPALAVSPDDAADAVRAAKLMSALSGDLKTRADALKLELETLALVQTDIEEQQKKLAVNEAELAKKRTRIKDVVTQKSSLERSISSQQADAQKRAAALASEANSLRDLIRRFESSTRDVVPRLKPDVNKATRPSSSRPQTSSPRPRPSAPLLLPDGTLKFAEAKGRIRPPVSGRITKSYTTARKGMTVATRPKAQVIAPHTGRVEFAGPFKNYDSVVILNMGEGYFMLLTGLGEVYVETNDMVSSGEPLGLMPFNTQSQTELYIEIRKDGAAVNPSPWLGTAFAG